MGLGTLLLAKTSSLCAGHPSGHPPGSRPRAGFGIAPKPLTSSQPRSSRQALHSNVILCSEPRSQDTRHLTHGNGNLENTSFALKFKAPVNYPPITLAQVLYQIA